MPDSLLRLLGKERATVPEVVEGRASETPDKTFLLYGSERYTYGEAWENALRFSAWMLELSGDAPPGRVATYLGNRPEHMWAWLGTAASGAEFVGLNREHRGPLLADMVARSGAGVLVTDREGAAELERCAIPEFAFPQSIVVVDDDGSEAAGSIAAPYRRFSTIEQMPAEAGPARGPGSVASILYTSGTTGRSKAVLVPHNQLCRGAARVVDASGMGPDDVFHGWLPLYHVAGQLDMTLAVVIAGATLALIPRFSRSRFWIEVDHVQATVFTGFPNVLEVLTNTPRPGGDASSTLRMGFMGYVPPDARDPFEERFGVDLIDIYGMTEVEPISLPISGEKPPPGSCGRPSSDLEVAILDADDLPLPPGSVGEIAVRPQVPDVMMKGYEGDWEATASSWRNLWFHTGDLGRFDEQGFLYFVDRRSHAIRRRGENVSSWELEGLIARHPAVQTVAAVGVPSAVGDEEVKAIVELVEGAHLSAPELHAWCGDTMARFMVPRFIEIRDGLPRTRMGKVLKEDLRIFTDDTWDAESDESSPELALPGHREGGT